MIFLSNRKLRLIIITLLLLIFCFFIGLFKSKALTINNAVYYKNGRSVALSGGNGSYADIAIKYYGGTQLDSVEKLSFYIEPNSTEQQYKYMSGFIRFENANPSGTYIPNVPIIQLAGNTCELEHSMSTGASYVAFTCPMAGGWIDFLNLPASLTSFYIQRNFGVSDMINNSSTLNQINTNVTNINDSINDSSIDSSSASSSSTEWNNKNATNGTITQLLTLPITLLQAIVNGISTSCSSFSLGSLFGTNITLPCINLSNLIGSGLFTTIDILFSGFMILAIGKKLIKIFNDFTNLKSNQIDELYGGGK